MVTALASALLLTLRGFQTTEHPQCSPILNHPPTQCPETVRASYQAVMKRGRFKWCLCLRKGGVVIKTVWEKFWWMPKPARRDSTKCITGQGWTKIHCLDQIQCPKKVERVEMFNVTAAIFIRSRMSSVESQGYPFPTVASESLQIPSVYFFVDSILNGLNHHHDLQWPKVCSQ